MLVEAQSAIDDHMLALAKDAIHGRDGLSARIEYGLVGSGHCPTVSIALRRIEAPTKIAASVEISGDAAVDICAALEKLDCPIVAVELPNVAPFGTLLKPMLRSLYRFCARHTAVLVASGANAAHDDALAELVGEPSIDDDEGWFAGFKSGSFCALFEGAGFTESARRDVLGTRLRPGASRALGAQSPVAQIFRSVRDRTDPYGEVMAFVRAFIPSPRMEGSRNSTAIDGPRPFLSVVMRTQGRRPQAMLEALLALTCQSTRDFELIIVGHKLEEKARADVQRLVGEMPDWLGNCTRFIEEQEGNRTRPLNTGFLAAKGEYIAILDDDDLPFAHWVECFATLANSSPGRVLRTVAAKQSVRLIECQGRAAIRALGSPEPYPPMFDLIDHLRMNQTPPVAVAFPRTAFSELGLRFDETLTTTEDWDLLLQASMLLGVACSPEITSIYRWWDDTSASSRTEHAIEEWQRNYEAIHRKIDAAPLILPPGSLTRLLRHGAQGHGGGALHEIVELLESRSWRVTAPLRAISQILFSSGPVITISSCLRLSDEELKDVAADIRSSRSWRLTAPLRKIGHKYR